MTAVAKRIPGDVFGLVSEQAPADIERLLSLEPAFITEMTAGDDDPQFVIVRVEEGKSHNKRIWPAHVLETVVKQVNDSGSLPGYKGHIPDDQYGSLYPPTQTRWFKGVSRKENGKTVAYFKGYNLPGTEIRREVKQGLARTVSWIGNAAMKAVKDGYEVVEFIADSLDWSRPGAEGMNAKLVTVAAEMNANEGGKVDAAEIGRLTESDLDSNCPALVRVFEMRGEQKAQAKIAEAEQKAESVKGDSDILTKLMEMLGLEKKDNVLDNVATLVKSVNDIGKEKARQAIDAALVKLVPDEKNRAIVSQLAVVSEMKVEGEDQEAREKDADAKLRSIFNTNDVVKGLVGEMQTTENGNALGNTKGADTRDGDKRYAIGSEADNLTVSRVNL